MTGAAAVGRERFDVRAMLRIYLFFWYFSGVPQLVYFAAGAGAGSLVIDSFFLSLIWLLPEFCLPRWKRATRILIGVTLWSASLVGLFYFGIHGRALTQSVVFAMFESNPEETREFFSQYFNPLLMLGIVAYTVGALVLWQRQRSVLLHRIRAWPVGVAVLAVTLAYPLMTRHGLDASAPWKIITGYTQYQRQVIALKDKLVADRILSLENLHDANGDTPRTLVLVIGESTTSRHMSLYGYSRKTSPRLEALRESDPGLTVFEDVIAPRPTTIEVLQQALTFANQEEPNRFLNEPAFMDLMRQAGYKTFWITNQQTMNRFSLLGLFPRQADEVYYLNHQFDKDANRADEVVLAPFARVLRDDAPKKLIVVHLMGAHLKYGHRYPPAFDHFKDAESVPGLTGKKLDFWNTYDNAVRYNDYVVSELIKTYAESKPNGFLLYFSDHGEEVYDTPPHEILGRDEDLPTRGMYAIPFIIWTSPAWQAAHPRDLKTVVGRKYSTTHLIHTFSDLAGLSYDRYRPELSVVNDKFKPFTRWIGDPARALRDYDKGL